MSWMDRTRERLSRNRYGSLAAMALVAIVIVLVLVALFWRA